MGKELSRNGNPAAGAPLYKNLLSYIGFLVLLAGAFLTISTVFFDFLTHSSNPYIGIFSYMIFPGIMAFGFAVVLYGMRRESIRRRKKSTEGLPYPVVDLNDPKHRKTFTMTLFSGFIFVMILGFVGFNAFLFTESNKFCGELCHEVMEPEYSAYQHSAHARVHCVECHVGSGTSFYVKSKLSGVRQVFGVIFDNFNRPIKTPLHNLRPAREVCEECHWPEKFYGQKLLQLPHYRMDEANSSSQISLLMKTGGGSSLHGKSNGIHWHMIIDNRIEYIASDDKLQEVPWMRATSSDGTVTEYAASGSDFDKNSINEKDIRLLDCMDCHNRPSHRYPPPDEALDKAMKDGAISDDLPWIKKTASIAAMTAYGDSGEAMKGIENAIISFYSDNYPDILKNRAGDIGKAVAITQGIYGSSVFPKMKVDWSTYPENIGHRNWKGCFRCHDGKHNSTSDGIVLTNDCTVCHTAPKRGPVHEADILHDYGTDWHTFPLTGKHSEILCSECHSAGTRPNGDCMSCHRHETKNVPMGDFACLDCHSDPGVLTKTEACDDCHSSLSGEHKTGMHADADCLDCHKQHTWTVTKRETCESCHDDKKDHNPGVFCGECHEFKED